MKKLLLFFVTFTLLLTACKQEAELETSITAQSLTVEDIYTAVALTFTAQPVQATATQYIHPTAPATITAAPTISGFGRPTQQTFNPVSAYSAGGTANGCYDSAYVSDVTIPDGTILTPGETFTKTWQFQNTGSCAWDEDFLLTYVSGEDMDGANSVIGTSVAVGSSGSLSVSLIAPETAGSYTGYWQLANATGTTFGQSVYVMITVSGSTATPSFTSTLEYTSTPTNTSVPTETYTPTAIPTDTPIQ